MYRHSLDYSGSRPGRSGRQKMAAAVLALGAWMGAAACGGRTSEELFDTGHPDGSAGASAATTGNQVGSVGATSGVSTTSTTSGAGGNATTTGSGGAGVGKPDGGGGSGPNPQCNPSNCDGCCDAQYRCRSGGDLNACGVKAAGCIDCGAIGFACTAKGTCEGVAPPCGPANCSGCCNDKGLCRFGTESEACGSGGGKCDDCASRGEGCSGGVCAGPPPICGAMSCGGCCDATGACRAGASDVACGAQGASCQSCAAKSERCMEPGNYCAAPLPCSTVCPAGCCDAGGVCHAPADTTCGTLGQSCSDCTTLGRVCAPQGYCYAGVSCGSGNCAGCCTATGQCLGGADSAACGQFGSLCDNCSDKAESCRNQVCSNGSICPSSYAGCNPDAVTEPPITSTSCSAQDLASVVGPCSGAATGCNAAFARLLAGNPACAGCLAQFVNDQAIARCLAPYLSKDCNHYLTCGVACSNDVCSQCPAAQTNACQNSSGQAGGPCNPYAFGWSCALAAMQGPGSFCNFNMYMDAGLWLDAVGGRYCSAR